MNIGDIKIEALHLMFATQGDRLSSEELADLYGREDYGSYLVAMRGSVNRCYADLEIRGTVSEPIARLSDGGDDTETCPLPDCIAAWIPYWIVGELYREDEPELAAEMMARYEKHIGQIVAYPQKETVYSLTEV